MSMAAPLATHLGTPARLDRLGGGRWWRAAKHALDGASPLAVLSPASGRSMLNGRAVNDNALISRQGGIKYVVGADGVLSAVPANTLAYDWSSGVRELLLEGQATNSLRNSTMQGTVVGSPGTTPTYWSVSPSGTSGLIRQIVGFGTILGMPYIDFRWYGTVTAAGGCTMYPEASTVIAAASGDTWTHSVYLAVVGGSLAGCSLTYGLVERSSSGSALNANTPTVAPGPSLTRYAATLTFVNASTVYVGPTINLVPGAIGSAVDVTVRIAAPQLEKSPTATSYIPTSGATVTRPADIAPLWSGAGAATAWALRCSVPLASTFGGVGQALLSTETDTILRSSTTTATSLAASATVSAQVIATGVIPGIIGAMFGWGGSGGRGTANGQAVVDMSRNAYTPITLRLGRYGGLENGQVMRLRELVAWQLSDRPSAAGCQSQARLWSA